MDIVKHDINPTDDPAYDFLLKEQEFKNDEHKAVQTSQRLHYEAHVEVVRKQLGGLEEIRVKLGLSGRKLCQLLLVDPSAWTRWKKEGAPPHIWRALQWYFIIQEKIPGLAPAYFLGRDPQIAAAETSQKLQDIEQKWQARQSQMADQLALQNLELKKQIENLQGAVKANRMTAMMLGLATLLMGVALWKVMSHAGN
jgi:hypothetical protein